MRVGFVGAGNMAAAMARGWAAQPGGPQLAFTDAVPAKAERLAAELGGEARPDARALAESVDLVVLATKPAQLPAVAAEMRGAAGEDSAFSVLSILGGVPRARVAEAFPGTTVVRAIPNLPVAVRRGVICWSRDAERGDAGQVADLLGVLGDAIELPDEQIDVATALMSTTPAYLALVAEALIDAGIEQGLPADLAQRLAVGAVAGSGELMESLDPVSVRRGVTSPGGITAAGLAALERSGVRAAIADAVRASLARMRG